MQHSSRLAQRAPLYLVLAAVALANGGCLVVAAGAAGGAAVGYYYYKGKVCGMYHAALNDSWAATHTALAELGMAVLNEEHEGTSGYIKSRTADGDHIRIQLEAVASRVPAEGQLTRICVRVATFGDRLLSERILDQIGMHLAPANLVPAPPPAATLGAVQPASAQTPAPPLATPAAAPSAAAPPPSPEPIPARK